MELQNFKKEQTVSGQFSVEKAFAITKIRADSMLAQKDEIGAHETYIQLIRDYVGLVDLKAVRDTIAQIEASGRYRKQARQKEKIDHWEIEERKFIGEAFTELYVTKLKVEEGTGLKDMSWWKNKIDYYRKLTHKSDFQTRNMALRLINVIWARSAESSFNYMGLKDYETAQVLNEVWLYAEPNNWGRWNMAKTLAYQGDMTFFSYLQEIVSGPTQLSKRSILQEKAFQEYVDLPQMEIILSQLK